MPVLSFCCRVLVSIQSLIQWKKKPYSTVEKSTVLIFNNEKIQKLKKNHKDTGFVDIQDCGMCSITESLNLSVALSSKCQCDPPDVASQIS